MHSEHRRLAGNVVALGFLQAANYLLPLVTIPYLFQVLEAHYFGLLSTAQYYAQFFLLICDYGFTFSATRTVSLYRHDKEYLSRVFSGVMLIKLCLLLVGFLLLVILLLSTSYGAERALFLAAFAATAGQVLFPSWLFQGLEKMYFITVIQVIPRVLATVALFIWVRSPADYLLAAVITSSGFLLAGIASCVVVFAQLRIRLVRPTFSLVRNLLREGWSLFLSVVATSVYTVGGVPLLSAITANYELVGYYAAAEKLIRAITSLYQVIITAFFPFFSRRTAEAPQDTRRLFFRFISTVSFFTLLTSLAVALFGKAAGLWILGPEFAHSVSMLRILSPVLFLGILSASYAYLLYYAVGWSRRIPLVYGLGSLFFLLMALYLPSRYGAEGMAWALTLTELLVTAGFIIWFKYGYRDSARI